MKKLTVENWLEIDPIIASGVFVRVALASGKETDIEVRITR